MPKTKTLALPTNYEVQPSFDDNRFTKVKIWVMHDGLNKNYSFFDMDAINDAAESIKNIPILAFVKKVDGSGNEDFAGHEAELVITDNEFKYRYLGRPIGIIPEVNNDYHIEIRDDKHYVVVNGYIWNDYANEALDILLRDGVKGQSMEIRVDDYDYDYEKDYYVIKKYRYTGLTLLGDDVPPAMTGAKAEVVGFSVNDKCNKIIKQMAQEIHQSFQQKDSGVKINQKGGATVAKFEELLKKYGISEEQLKEANINVEEFEDEKQFEARLQEVFGDEGETEDVKAVKEMLKKQGYTGKKIGELAKTVIAVASAMNSKSDEIRDLQAQLGQLKMEFDSLKEEYDKLEKENKELREYKQEQERALHEKACEAVFAEFPRFSEEEIADLKENIHSFSVEDLRKELFARYGQKALKQDLQAPKKKEKEIVKMEFQVKNSDKKSHIPYANLLREFGYDPNQFND